MIWIALIAVAIAGSLLDRLNAPPRFIEVKVDIWNSGWLYDYGDQVFAIHPHTGEVVEAIVIAVYDNHVQARLPA